MYVISNVFSFLFFSFSLYYVHSFDSHRIISVIVQIIAQPTNALSCLLKLCMLMMTMREQAHSYSYHVDSNAYWHTHTHTHQARKQKLNESSFRRH